MIRHTGLRRQRLSRRRKLSTRNARTLGYETHGTRPRRRLQRRKEHRSSGSGRATRRPTHVAFEAKNKGEVERSDKAASPPGGIDDGGPGYGRDYWPGYYAAFVYDRNGTTSKPSGTTHRTKKVSAGAAFSGGPVPSEIALRCCKRESQGAHDERAARR